MRRQIIVMFFSLFLFSLPQAWSAPPDAAQPQAVHARGALFKITAGGHSAYLFGTMHMGLPDFYPLEPTITAAVAHASVLALEVDPQRDPASMAGAMQKYGFFAPGSNGYKDMAPALRPRLEQVLKARHIEMAAVATLKPWLLSAMLALGEFASQGYRTDLAVDGQLAKAARAAGVPVMELESAEAQLALFDSLTPAEQWRFLEDSIDGIESGKQVDQVRQIVDAWRSANQVALEEVAAQAEADQSFSGRFVQKVLLDGRNGALADKIDVLLRRENNSVVAIGVLHLLGKDSVPQLLRQKGVKVERIY